MRRIKYLLTSLLIMVCLIPTSVVVNASEVGESDELVEIASKYFSAEEDGKPIYNREQAVEDGLDETILEIADCAYQFMVGQYRYDTTGIQTRGPIYGNWCGPNYGSGTPIDLLDTGCRTHDRCYGSRGYHKCSCDKDFRNYINNNLSKMSGTQKVAANAMKVWLNVKISNVTKSGGNLSCRL